MFGCELVAYPNLMSTVVSAAKPIPGRFHPIKSPSTKLKAPHKRKGIVTDLSVSKRQRFDSKNRGLYSRINSLDVTPLSFPAWAAKTGQKGGGTGSGKFNVPDTLVSTSSLRFSTAMCLANTSNSSNQYLLLVESKNPALSQ